MYIWKYWCRLPLLFALCAILLRGHAINFYIHAGERRCFQEDLPTNTRIRGEVRVASGPGHMVVDVQVTTLKSKHVLYYRYGDKTTSSKFSFMTPVKSEAHDANDYDTEEYAMDTEDTYQVCIGHFGGPLRPEERNLRRRIYYHVSRPLLQGARNEQHARSEHTSTLLDRLREMHTELASVVGDLSRLEQREHELLKRNALTSSRLTVLAIASLLVMVAASVAQYLYYKKYFKAKKLC